MSDDLTAAAQALGIPENLTLRSAEARAKAQGVPVEDVLRAWAGGAAMAPSAPAAAPPEEPAEETAPGEPAAPEPEEAAPVDVPAPAPAPVAARPEAPPLPVPESVGPEEATEWEAVTSVPTAGLKERTKTRIPVWLSSLFVVLPLVAILSLLLGAGGPACGEAGLLAIDRATGEVVNCDGSRFEGRGAPGGTTDFLALGQALYADTQVACNGCHGTNGEGGVGPAFTGGAVLATFPTCADHVTWVQLGSSGWQAQVGPEYGATNKLSQGGMPSFGDSLPDQDLRSVVLYERVRFGGEDLEQALVDCGLVVPETPAEGEETTETVTETGEETVTETTTHSDSH